MHCSLARTTARMNAFTSLPPVKCSQRSSSPSLASTENPKKAQQRRSKPIHSAISTSVKLLLRRNAYPSGSSRCSAMEGEDSRQRNAGLYRRVTTQPDASAKSASPAKGKRIVLKINDLNRKGQLKLSG